MTSLVGYVQCPPASPPPSAHPPCAAPLQVQRTVYGPVVNTALGLGGSIPITVTSAASDPTDALSFEAFVDFMGTKSFTDFHQRLQQVLLSPTA